jgi:hypothetical protein
LLEAGPQEISLLAPVGDLSRPFHLTAEFGEALWSCRFPSRCDGFQPPLQLLPPLNRRPQIIPKSCEGIGQIAVEHRLTAPELPPPELLDLMREFGSFGSVVGLLRRSLGELSVHERRESGAAGERINYIAPHLRFDELQPDAALSTGSLSGHRIGAAALVVRVAMRVAAAYRSATASATQDAGKQVRLRWSPAIAFAVHCQRLLRTLEGDLINERRNADVDPLRFRAVPDAGALVLAGARRFSPTQGFRRSGLIPGQPARIIRRSAGDLENRTPNPPVTRRRRDAVAIQ